MILWMDGFDHYGTSRANMDQYGFVGADWAPSTINPRTGTHSLHCAGGGAAGSISSTCVFRRPLLTPHTTCKLGYGFWVNRYPSDETGFLGAVAVVMAGWLTAGGVGNITLTMGTDGSIAAYDHWAWDQGLFFTHGTEIGRSNPGVVHVAAWNHFECFMVCDSSAGSVEVRIDGVTVLSLASINTNYYGTGTVTQVLVSAGGLNNLTQFDIDDIVASDDVGANADFLGDMQVFTDFPDADAATQDWIPSSGALAYPMVDEASPDGDGTYIEAVHAGDIAGMTFPGLPANLTEVAAVGFYHRSKKLGPGGSTILQTVVSGASSTPGYDGPVTTVYAGYLDVFETDPATALPWLKAAAAAAELDLERTA